MSRNLIVAVALAVLAQGTGAAIPFGHGPSLVPCEGIAPKDVGCGPLPFVWTSAAIVVDVLPDPGFTGQIAASVTVDHTVGDVTHSHTRTRDCTFKVALGAADASLGLSACLDSGDNLDSKGNPRLLVSVSATDNHPPLGGWRVAVRAA